MFGLLAYLVLVGRFTALWYNKCIIVGYGDVWVAKITNCKRSTRIFFMSSKMQITGILLKNYRQFRNFRLDLIDPDTGAPLEKVCFIGSNGTGKSTLLALISQFWEEGQPGPLRWSERHMHSDELWRSQNGLIGFKIRYETSEYFVLHGQTFGVRVLPGNIDRTGVWDRIWEPEIASNDDLDQFRAAWSSRRLEDLDKLRLQPNSNDLAIYAPPDGSSILTTGDLPSTNLSNALGLFNQFPAFHLVSYGQLEGFWNTLIYQIKKRESDFQHFLQQPTTQSLSVAEARQKFDTEHPEILTKLAEQWNLILDQAGLEFDVEHAQIPVQLNENLRAYVRFKATETPVPYNVLSTGMRNFLFRFGHIYALYFNRLVERGFLLIDEPEASLFPDLLYDVIDRYLAIIQNTQFFVATHSPVIASQFRPCERFILIFDDQGYVDWRRGVAAEGDDPNDLLLQDFKVRSLYGKKGIEQWQRFLKLRREIKAAVDPTRKQALLDEYTKIGNAYNFDPHEIPA